MGQAVRRGVSLGRGGGKKVGEEANLSKKTFSQSDTREKGRSFNGLMAEGGNLLAGTMGVLRDSFSNEKKKTGKGGERYRTSSAWSIRKGKRGRKKAYPSPLQKKKRGKRILKFGRTRSDWEAGGILLK